MKLLHVLPWYLPESVGGTEIYVDDLAQALRPLGWESTVAIPGVEAEQRSHNGIDVLKFAASQELDIDAVNGGGDSVAAANFNRLVHALQPDCVHIHALTAHISAQLVASTVAHGFPVVFTQHVPEVTCRRGTLMRWGKIPCDGAMLLRRCTQCDLQSRDVPMPLAAVLSFSPAPRGSAIRRLPLSERARTAISMRSLVKQHHASVASALDAFSMITVHAEWTRDVLVRNGVDENKIALIRHGTSFEPLPSSSDSMNENLKIAFVGRLSAIKGAHLLIEALSLAPIDERLHLDMYLVDQPNREYTERLRTSVESNPHIRLLPAIGHDELPAMMRRYDVLAIPSQVLETGPLVALEALACGTLVVGSDLGGIAESIQDGVNGILVRDRTARAWRRAFDDLVRDPGLGTKLRSGIKPPRSMRAVAEEMVNVYERVMASTRRPSRAESQISHVAASLGAA
jgi:glycosyltransferase involved in cell wall biosynthesis